MIVAADGRAEKSHHLVTDELVKRAVVTKDRARGELVKAIELHRYLGGRELLGERGKAANVGEEDGNMEHLPVRRSQLVSKRAKIGIFPRRANLQEPKRHEAFLAASCRRQDTIGPARNARGADALAQHDEKFLHEALEL
jgi:hypothetical protein